MKQSGHLNPSEETGTGFPVTSKYGRTPPNKHGGMGTTTTTWNVGWNGNNWAECRGLNV